MKKLLILFLLLSFVGISYSEVLKVRAIVQSMNVISPDGETKSYTDPEDVPNITYSSKIIANGMLILDYHSVGIILKNKQGLFVSKDPITNVLVFSKVENTRSGAIVITFDAETVLQMDADTIFSLKYDEQDTSVTMKIIDGHAIMKINDDTIELIANETYKHIFKGKGQTYAI